MGDEVSIHRFKESDFLLFQQKLEQETEFVRRLFAQRKFDNSKRRLGYELELCLLDETGSPAPLNDQVLTQAGNPLFTYELARFNLEINGHAFALRHDVFERIERDLEQLYTQVERAAADFGAQPGLFGILPSLFERHLEKDHFMSDMYRYRILDRRLMDMRERPVQLDIQGEERLQVEKNDVMLEALGTSLQIHYQLPFDEVVDGFHASLWASMAVLAAAANSPLVLGRHCWQESRIAVFKQAVDTRNPQEVHDAEVPRVHLARGYISSWLELFEDNLNYSPILPEVLDSEIGELHHFNLHNGTIWRWVRPVLGRNERGEYHLRLELRVAPSGPTRIDSMANMVFYIGLIEGLKQVPEELTRIPYQVLEQDFYQVARHGLNAKVSWCNGKMDSMQALLQRFALPQAHEGLKSLAIDNADKWLDIIHQRVQSGRTGAHWIEQHWQRNANANELVSSYLKNARANTPVHAWPDE